MAILQGNAKQGSTRGFYPRVINGSLRFNDDDSAYLSWTPASAGNRKTWTWSGWVKRGNLTTGVIQGLFAGNSTASDVVTGLRFEADDTIKLLNFNAGYQSQLITSQVFRDTASWYHIVGVMDTTNATSSDRLRLYVNGQRITAFSTATYPSLNFEGYVNTTNIHVNGAALYNGVIEHLDGYLSDVYFIDGQALSASDFGETKNGVWVAKDYAGTFGTNGFHLTFEDDTEVEAFNTVLYKGAGGVAQSITGMGFQPDLVWIKSRTGTQSHFLFDAVRGAGVELNSNLTDAESTDLGLLSSFDTDGFSLGSTAGTNSSNDYVAWGWKAGDSNVSNTDGSITSTVRANDTYGFSIVSYTGNGTAGATIGHGLSSAPDMMIVRRRTVASGWMVYHSANTANPETEYLSLQATDATTDDNTRWNDTAPTSSVFSVGTAGATNASGGTYIAYCWAEKTGYSKFGSYEGDHTNGVTVSCGFEPSMVLVKNIDSASDWEIYDDTRRTNGSGSLEPNTSDAENLFGGNFAVTFSDTGFTLPAGTQRTATNETGNTYIYAAFADTREAAFWLDQSGNDNDWQPVNLDHNDTVADSPTDNFATLNPLSVPSSPSRTFSDGNLRFDATTNNAKALGTILLPTSGQWYWEATQLGGTTIATIGVADANYNNTSTGRIGYRNDALKIDETGTTSSYGATYQSGDVIGVAFDADADTLTFYKNGVSQGTAFTGMAARSDNGLVPFVQAYTTTPFAFNFGQQPFKYDPPA